MTFEDALAVVGLNRGMEPADIEQALAGRLADLTRRMEAAPTEALREKYGRQLGELRDARLILLRGAGLNANDAADLPIAESEVSGLPSASFPAGAGLPFGPRIGQSLAGRYLLRSLEHQGQTANVFQATDSRQGGAVRVRVLSPQVGGSARAREAFIKAAAARQRIQAAGLSTIIEAGADGPYLFLVTGGAEDLPLPSRLSEMAKRRARFTPDEAARLVRDLATALDSVHKASGPIGGLTPNSVVIGPTGAARLDDIVSPAAVAESDVRSGDGAHVAPEVRAGRPTSLASDQFALGAILYEAFAGISPAGLLRPLGLQRPDLPKALASAIDRSLSAEPASRFPDIAAFLVAGSRPDAKALLKRPVVMAVGGVMALALILAIGIPVFGAMTQGQSQARSERLQVAELESAVSVQADLIGDVRSAVESDAKTARSRVEQLQGQARSARDKSDRDDIEKELATARVRSDRLNTIEREFEDQFGAKVGGFSAIKGAIARAKAQSVDGFTAEALKLYQDAGQQLASLIDLPARMERDFLAGDAFATIVGRWRLDQDVCAAAFGFSISGYKLVVERQPDANGEGQYSTEIDLLFERGRIRGAYKLDGKESRTEYLRQGDELVVTDGGETYTMYWCG